jgi:hypothetical protein
MAKFSKRHYIAIAAVINECDDLKIKEKLFTEFSLIFAIDNPLFDVYKFRRACYPEEV